MIKRFGSKFYQTDSFGGSYPGMQEEICGAYVEYINYEASQSRVERLEAALRGILESENSAQYGKPKGMHERDCSSVQDYKRVIPCDCIWGRARLALTNDAGEGA